MSAPRRRPRHAARDERSPAGNRSLLSRTAGILLWVLAGIGVLSGGLWVANQAGWIQPLVVVSGSMSPTIDTGDLVIAVGKPATDLAVGEIASLHSEVTNKYVTHRVTSVTALDGATSVTMRGDANEIEDSELYTYASGERVWSHWLTIPGGGTAVIALAEPGVLIPGLLGLLALIGFALLPPRPAPALSGTSDGNAAGAASVAVIAADEDTGRQDGAAGGDGQDLVSALLGPVSGPGSAGGDLRGQVS